MATVVVTLRLNTDKDADLLERLSIIPKRQRSQVWRTALRLYYNPPYSIPDVLQPVPDVIQNQPPKGRKVKLVIHKSPEPSKNVLQNGNGAEDVIQPAPVVIQREMTPAERIAFNKAQAKKKLGGVSPLSYQQKKDE